MTRWRSAIVSRSSDSSPTLRRVQAHPDHAGVRVVLPEAQELLQVAVAPDLLPRDRAVDGDAVAGDVLENPLVGGRGTPHVVLRRKSVHRHDHLKPAQTAPLRRNRPHRARDELRVDVPCGELRQNRAQLAIAHERLAAHDGDVQRPPVVDQSHEPLHELFAAIVRQATERDAAPQVLVPEGVTAGTAQRALARDLDRQVGPAPGENPAPRLHHTSSDFTLGCHTCLLPSAPCRTVSVVHTCQCVVPERFGSNARL